MSTTNPQTPVNPETLRFREVLDQGRFCVPKCNACGKSHWYPRAFCPFCFSEDILVKESAGEGTIYSYSVMTAKPPIVIAYVALAEGPKMMTNIVDVDPATVQVGMKVKVVFRNTPDGVPMPFFTAA